jgi:RNA polymerase sigma-70 factor (ECF subfamily)
MFRRTPEPSGREVFEILVQDHADMLAAYLRSLVRRSDLVDDLFQETMLVAWRRLGDYDRQRPFGPWLRGIAQRIVLAQRRSRRRDFLVCEPAVLEAIDLRMRRFESPLAGSFSERLRRLQECLERLPERLRESVSLAYGRRMLLREIATALSATEEAVKKRVQRARVLLAECLQTGGGAA